MPPRTEIVRPDESMFREGEDPLPGLQEGQESATPITVPVPPHREAS